MLDIKMSFGQQLKRIRNKKGFTQENLAELLDINQRQLSRIESGRSFPSSVTMEKICKILNIHPVDLFNFPNKKIRDIFEDYDEELYDLICLSLQSISKQKFLKLALQAVNNDKKALNKLQNVIEGMQIIQE